ncbi:MAG: MFS transporter [Myxococcota bacterium]
MSDGVAGRDVGPTSTPRLSPVTMACYGFGQMAEALVTTGFTVFLLFYYNQVLVLPGGLAGLALAIALAVDATTDPLVGALSDRLRSSWGRRHPFMALAAVPLALSFWAVFNPPAGLSTGALFAWLTIFAVLTRLALTLYAVPHLALGAELARDYGERSTIFSFNLLFGSIGSLFGGALSLRCFFPSRESLRIGLLDANGYPAFSATFAVLMVVAIFVSVWGTRNEIPRLPGAEPALPRLTLARLGADLGAAFANRSFRALFFGISLSAVAAAIEAALAPFVGTHFWGLTTERLALLPLCTFAGIVAGMFLVAPVTSRLDRKTTLIGAALIAIVAGHALVVIRLIAPDRLPDRGSDPIVILVGLAALAVGVMGPLVFANLNAMFADIVDEHELFTGERREGIIFSARTFVVKAAQSIGVVLGGLTLDAIRFPKNAEMDAVSSEVLWRLGLAQGLVASSLTLLGVVLYARYRLDRARHASILAQLATRHRTIR